MSQRTPSRPFSGLSPAGCAILLRGSRRRPNGPVVRSLRHGGKVVLIPCPDGVVRMTGLGPGGEWIAEWACREGEFTESMIDRMERHVRKVVGRHLEIVV